jgi:hypothetical protein
MTGATADKLEMLRGEQIKANFLIYGDSTFSLNCTCTMLDRRAGEVKSWRGFRAWNGLHQQYE